MFAFVTTITYLHDLQQLRRESQGGVDFQPRLQAGGRLSPEGSPARQEDASPAHF